jgi:hypothetical protein|tara:strand:- start:1366 stop:2991 length:1626 start_codon:yes stop_codon:yes gene_type:complete
MYRISLFICFILTINSNVTICYGQENPLTNNYTTLVNLFEEWRTFENPPKLNGVPNYTKESFNKRHQNFNNLQIRLNEINIDEWPIHEQIDWHVVRAEMNGYDFNYRVLKPWERDPAYYQTIWMHQSDVPAHEGPTNHAVLELWEYKFPLSKKEKNKFINELKIIPPFLDQARRNLTGNARDLWIAGIENLKQQVKDLDFIALKFNSKEESLILNEIEISKNATEKFIKWLELASHAKKGPSGIGKENYTWYQKNVHLLPLSWEEEVQLLQRELDRAWSSLKLEEHRNKDLPLMTSAKTPEEFKILTEKGVKRFMSFLDKKDIMYIKKNMEPALRSHMGKFVPENDRNFFNIGLHYDPLPLYSHFVHWFDLAEVKDKPHKSIIRRGPLLYNIFDTKNEGYATGAEEMFMHSGLYDDSPRSREIVWIMIAQRAARGLGSLYAHSNQMTMAEAGQVHVKWTPRGWMNREPHLLQFEQHLYLRQPGYGTSYITGKYIIEKILTEWSKKLEENNEPFIMKDFFKAFNNIGNIPVELARWEMTGIK